MRILNPLSSFKASAKFPAGLPSMRILAAAIVAMSLAACSKEAEPPRSAGEKLDLGIAKVERQGEQMKAEVQRGAEDARQAASEAAHELKSASLEAREQLGSDLSDAGLVTTIKAKLAADTLMTMSSINVDASQGRVTLRGSVADAGAVARARQIASAVKGVTAVDNQLMVAKKT